MTKAKLSQEARDAIERTINAKRKLGGLRCWATKIDGPLKEYVDWCREQAMDKGNDFYMNCAYREAVSLGLPVRDSAFEKHVKGLCSCDEKEAE